MEDMQNFKTDSQLPAVGEGEDSFGAGGADDANFAQTGSPDGGEAKSGEAAPGNSMGIVVDPKSGKRTVRLIALEEKKAESQEMETAQTQEEDSQEVVPYTPQELIAASQLGAVDERRVPDELKPNYAVYKQQLLQQAQRLQASLRPEQPPNQAVNPKEVYAALADMALENTLTELGMSKADFEALSYSDDPNAKAVFDVAHQSNIQKLIAKAHQARFQEEANLAERRAVYNDIGVFIENVKREEVNFEAIDALMSQRYKTLPYEQAEKIAWAISNLKQGSIRREHLPILEAYYKDTREAFYAQKNSVSKTPKRSVLKPPAVEPAGSGAKAAENIDFTQLRTMNRKEKEQLLEKYFARRIQ